MENLNCTFISGGYYRCTPSWNERPARKQSYYKLYYVVEGRADIDIDGQGYTLTAGNIYFINGFLLDTQRCDRLMVVYWLHFTPESQWIAMILQHMHPYFCWKADEYPFYTKHFMHIPALFDHPELRSNHLVEPTTFQADITSKLGLLCHTQSMVLGLLAELVHNQPSTLAYSSYELYQKLEPAIRLMNDQYTKNLTLEEIAHTIFLNPVYFLRLFKKCFSVTPNRYLVQRRLTEAARLLLGTHLSVKDVAEQTGFCNQFYFSKVFKEHYQLSPLAFRDQKHLP